LQAEKPAEVLVALRRRAELFGPAEPYHFVFASCKPKFNGTIPICGWRTAWRRLTRTVCCSDCGRAENPGVQCVRCEADISEVRSPLHGLRFHDLRHHAITELAESGASEQTIKAMAGHVSERMLKRYSHIRLEAKRLAMQGLSAKGYATNHATKTQEQPVAPAATH